jgi:F0F1-type ATP synthase assembly protein I
MDDQPGLSDQYRMSSPWPLIVVLGLVFSELGLFFNVFAVAVGGLLLFVGSIVGIVLESGYAEQPWNLLAGLGIVLVILGVVVTVTQLDGFSVGALVTIVSQPSGIVARGVELLIAGVITVIAGTGGRFIARESI